ncbi:hypothetical protein BJY22_006279 [Kribbella shirazensis]|uniref:HNH nuclease domain-containing protein n=2 Tax=Kribbella shirazensis TaxID=1105143 RepID=A0A7X5VHE0_9ACTN|nr:hypothetical protein [Kribbella shirazensis]
MPGFGAKAQVTVTIDFQDLKAATANASGQLVYGDGLSAATVRRLACDARIIPLVLGTNSEPLDVGRSERLVTRAMRRALNARDRGCVICGAPPIMCDAHHLQSWIDGGETKVSNLVLLCRRHHVDLHRGQWTVTIVDGTVHVARPTWAEPPPAHRSPRRRTDHTPDSPPDTTTQPGADMPIAPAHAHGTLTPTADTPTASAHADGTVTPADVATAPAHADGTATPAAASPAGLLTSLVAGDPVVPSTRQSRWKADEATLQQAAAFALASAPSG